MIPQHITSNPFLANAYAKLVLAFLSDCRVGEDGGDIAPGEPVYIIEEGCGPGRFGYYFLKRFVELHARSAVKDVSFRYVMTDCSASNLKYVQAHPALQPFVDRGELDFGFFDAADPGEIHLLHSGGTLSPATTVNPIVVFANYILDSIPQDAFHISAGILHECLVSISSSDPCLTPDADDFLDRVRISYENVRAPADYYGEPDLDGILEEYRVLLPGSTVCFPVAALRNARFFGRLSRGRLLFVSSDKGYTRDEDLLDSRGLGIVIHGGAFSIGVDYNAIGRFFKNQGGRAFLPEHQHPSLAVCAFVLGPGSDGGGATAEVYHDSFEEFGPTDVYNIVGAPGANRNIETILSLLRLSVWDASCFLACFAELMERIDDCSEALKRDLRQAVRQVWDFYYPMPGDEDVAYHLGAVLSETGYYTEAFDLFGQSAERYGMQSTTAYNMALCCYRLHKLEEALSYADESLTLDASFDAARALRIQIRSAL